jgi:predicted phosphodiesterase
MPQEVLAISGNHDCAENSLGPDDSLSVIAKAGRLRLLDHETPWRGTINQRPVVVGGTPWGRVLPTEYRADWQGGVKPLVFWLAHENVRFPGYDAGRIVPVAIPGVDAVINGHIHQVCENVTMGGTVWLNPGNIARVKRSDSARDFVPSVLRIDIEVPAPEESDAAALLWSRSESESAACEGRRDWRTRRLTVPHEPFDQVFHAEVLNDPVRPGESGFVLGLAELVARRTESGAGLREFLRQNLFEIDERVATEIMNLAEEVLSDGR